MEAFEYGISHDIHKDELYKLMIFRGKLELGIDEPDAAKICFQRAYKYRQTKEAHDLLKQTKTLTEPPQTTHGRQLSRTVKGKCV